MAAIAKSSRGVSLASAVPPSTNKINGLTATAAIAAGDAVAVNATGLAPVAAGATPRVDGFALTDAAIGEPVTAFDAVVVRYGDALTPGTPVYPSTTVAGGLDTTANGPIVGVCLDTQRIRLKATW